MQPCRNCRLTGGTAALLPEQKKKSPVVFLTALLLTLLLSDPAQEHGGAISTDITSCRSPTLLQQLASFAALREVAEEEQLDWGAPIVLGRQRRYSLCVQPERKEGEENEIEEKNENENENEEEKELVRGSDECTADSVTGSSRRRPHRRLHRRKKSAMQQGSDNKDNHINDDDDDVIFNDNQMYKDDDGMRSQNTNSGSSNGVSCGESSVRSLECVQTPRGSLINTNTNNANTPIANAFPAASDTSRIWSQLHVMEIALSTHDNNFIHITQRFLQYEAMYPIIYRCDLHQLIAPHEEELLAAPTTGLQTSRFWSCRSCGKAHDVVRETCVRCRRHSGPFTKLFFGQTIKETTDCARSVLRLLYATHPGITIHRIEAHQKSENGRGRGCASVYVSTDAASELISKLNGNVFFDTNRTSSSSLPEDHRNNGMDGLYVHYVYSSQRPWLEALIAASTSQRHHINTMPWGALVVEDSKENINNTGESSTVTTTKATKKRSGRKISKTTIQASRSSPTDVQIPEK